MFGTNKTNETNTNLTSEFASLFTPIDSNKLSKDLVELQYILTSLCGQTVSLNYYGSIKCGYIFNEFDYYVKSDGCGSIGSIGIGSDNNTNELCFGEVNAEMPDVFVKVDEIRKIQCDVESQMIVIFLSDGYCVIDWD